MRFPLKNLWIVLALLNISLLSHAAEKKILKSALPGPVARTAEKQSKGATVRAYTKDTENGKVEYEVEMTLNGHSKDVSIGADGGLLEVEEQVQIEALPAAVQQGLKQKAGKGVIRKIESITKRDVIVAYEAQVTTLGKHREIQVGPNGQTLDHEE